MVLRSGVQFPQSVYMEFTGKGFDDGFETEEEEILDYFTYVNVQLLELLLS